MRLFEIVIASVVMVWLVGVLFTMAGPTIHLILLLALGMLSAKLFPTNSI